ncbi:hypothetical protein BN7_5265 [Wickerhamomyces ciferrii]|uniref:SIS domain-containing protein n=1 Tax=Wickerhamomyces ciferrii (strain ATCC 14091 / BCRC 22168 / CBS 111 / JCM 3599 / NBRC 0793 / NRRL Y-1031 F-60-10) TaxID=1206466 RepID=K0KKD4_WICCF|nr:uncharacterized protein BN7_5265 [Wickerhamomyces ciferrii]CCH45680.1 hypothetical protein BN7_5265 [Wickerhamomyces ciferrii]
MAAQPQPHINHEVHLQNSLSTFDSILTNQTSSIHHLVNQYKHSNFSQNQLKKSLNILNSSLLKNGKIVISGIGKSHKIAAKTVATMNSLGLHSALLHPTEALHGDLGILRADHGDCLILISSSGKSPELLQLLPHISLNTPIILLTNKKKSLLSQHPQIKSLLYAELPSQLTEEKIYGLTAPTISTTLCLTLADAVSISLAELFIADLNERKKIFGERHPGGAIGEAYGGSFSSSNQSSVFNTPSYSSSSLSSTSAQSSSGFSPALNPTTSLTSIDDDEETLNDLPQVIFDIGYENEIQDEILIEQVKKSKNVGNSIGFFKNEDEILQSIALYDYVIMSQRFVISIDRLKSIYRIVYEHQYEDKEKTFNELNWRIKENLVRYT